MKIGFTGTRHGMTEQQKSEVKGFLLEHHHVITQVHHGMCVGADADFHDIAQALGLPIVGHPAFPVGHKMRAELECHDIYPVSPIWTRNRRIVVESDVLIATPWEILRMSFGGTWGTYAIAESEAKPRFLVWLDGDVEWGQGLEVPDGIQNR